MAFIVKFYTFSKKEKSTAQPSGAGVSVSCFANEALDILAPTIGLDWQLSGLPTVYNYAYIPDFGRYYFVNNWTNADGLWIAGLRVDALASQKTGIGAASMYVYRSSNEFDGAIIDTLYPADTNTGSSITAITTPWLTNQGAVSFALVIGVVSGDQVNYYSMSAAALQDLLSTLFSDTYAAALLGVLNITAFPEAKIAVNPLQYVTTCHKVPISPSLGSAQVTSIEVGGVTINLSNAARKIIYDGQTSARHTIAKANYPVHPQAASRGSWLNVADMQYKLHVPPFGIIDIPADIMWAADAIGYQVRCDVRTGDCHLDLIAVFGNNDMVISRVQSNVAVPMPLTHVYSLAGSPVYSYQSDNLVANALQLWDDTKTVLSGKSGIGNELVKRGNRLSMSGSVGSSVSMLGDCYLEATYHNYITDDNNDLGRPLCQIKQLSTIPGYIKADPDSLSLSCTVSEMDEIRAAISGGFYYE